MASTGLESLASGRRFFPKMTKRLGKLKVEKQVHRLTSDFKWNDDGGLELTQHIPGLRRDPASGRPTWFNGLVGRHGITRDIGALYPAHIGRDGMTYLPCVYGDKIPIPRKYLDKLIEVIDKEDFIFPLKKGIFAWWITIKCLMAENLGRARDKHWSQCGKVLHLSACTKV
ncbi:unnamed protein product [Clonostachys solani]|uniref:Uncharacterized protein n=1 Tax=Clonostachys solani TaxID=160281 RepID=A0A9P0EQI4_9HYPO|nr:unnamed protein product [Clonostachys solani]